MWQSLLDMPFLKLCIVRWEQTALILPVTLLPNNAGASGASRAKYQEGDCIPESKSIEFLAVLPRGKSGITVDYASFFIAAV